MTIVEAFDELVEKAAQTALALKAKKKQSMHSQKLNNQTNMAKQISNHLVKKAKKIMADGEKRSEQKQAIDDGRTERFPSIRTDEKTLKGITRLATRNRCSVSYYLYVLVHNHLAEEEGRRDDIIW